MYLSGNGAFSSDKKLTATKTTLNPNATEFVPFALRSPASGTSNAETSSKFAISTPGKGLLNRSESSVSNNSDDVAKEYWQHQLPDDIIPDFNVMGIDDTQEISSLSLANLSLADANEGSRYSVSNRSGFMTKEQQILSPRLVNGNSHSDKVYPVSSYGEYLSPKDFQPSVGKPWEKHIFGDDQIIAREGLYYNGNPRKALLADMSNEQSFLDNTDMNPLQFLASQFPGFAPESLAEVYFANAGDLNLTIEMLTQLELQGDAGLIQAMNSKAMSTPNLSSLDIPALSVTDSQNRFVNFADGDLHRNINPYRSSEKEGTLLFRSSSSIPSRGAMDFASAVRKMASQDSSIRKYSGSSEPSIGSSRSSRAYNAEQGRSIYGDRLQNRESAHASPIWLENGEAVANMYSEMWEEGRDHGCVLNAHLEQARQAYVIGNKALARELSIKGQLHNRQMKAAHGKAQETIYHQRNSDIQANGRDRMIDLHGLHVNEAIHVLKRELAVTKNVARSANQPMLVYIHLGTGHHTRGSRTPARLPTAVHRYLLEEEGLDYSEPQPGLLRAVIF